MTTFIVNKDIEILAVKANKGGTTFYQKTTNKQSTYSIEDIIVDPMGQVGIGLIRTTLMQLGLGMGFMVSGSLKINGAMKWCLSMIET